MKEEPTLEELGLDAPAKISDKISIERLQRESEYEREMSRQVSTAVARNYKLDLMAGVLALIVPGLGHQIKGQGMDGAFWFLAFLATLALSTVSILFLIVYLIVVIANVISAIEAKPK